MLISVILKSIVILINYGYIVLKSTDNYIKPELLFCFLTHRQVPWDMPFDTKQNKYYT